MSWRPMQARFPRPEISWAAPYNKFSPPLARRHLRPEEEIAYAQVAASWIASIHQFVSCACACNRNWQGCRGSSSERARAGSFVDRRRWASRSGASEGACGRATAAGKVRNDTTTTASTFVHYIQPAFVMDLMVWRVRMLAHLSWSWSPRRGAAESVSAGWRCVRCVRVSVARV